MNTGKIVGYVTRPNGSPICGAEIWISETSDSNEINFGNGGRKPSAKTDARGYFQLLVAGAGADFAEVVAVGSRLNVALNGRRDVQNNSEDAISENRFQVTGYMVRETLQTAD